MTRKFVADVTVVIPTFGDLEVWQPLVKRAMASALNQTRSAQSVYHYHEDTLAQARNAGAEAAKTEWLIFLDADDELDPHYIEAMSARSGDIRRPSTQGFYSDGTQDAEAVLIPERDLRTSNYIVIGAMIRREQFLKVGGFDELPILEDWDLWCRMVIDGAIVSDIPNAIYRVHVNAGSRNLAGDKIHGQVYAQIRKKYAGQL